MDVAAALGAGLLAGAVMSALLYTAMALDSERMQLDLFHLLGSAVFRDATRIYIAGAGFHGILSVAVGLVYGGVYALLGLEALLAAWGLLFGLLHYLAAGGALQLLPRVHPRIRDGELRAPEAYALAYLWPTAVGFLALHLGYGVLFGALYTAFY